MAAVTSGENRQLWSTVTSLKHRFTRSYGGHVKNCFFKTRNAAKNDPVRTSSNLSSKCLEKLLKLGDVLIFIHF